MSDYMKPPYTAELSDSIADGSDCWVIDNERGSVAEITCASQDAEDTARFLSRAGNAFGPLTDALTRLRDWSIEPMGGGLLHEKFDGEFECETECLRCAVDKALATE